MDTGASPAADELVAELSERLTAPDDTECLFCYVARMLEEFGCDTTLRWAGRWRDRRLPRATGLLRRLAARGGFCDCEVFLNGWDVHDELVVIDPATGAPAWPPVLPACAGVSRRSSQPCPVWVPRRRGR